jgi:hypothetical protein
MKTLLFGLVAIVAAGCATPAKTVSAPPEASALLFPYGNYVHEVKLSVPTNPDPSKRKFEFRGAVKIAEDVIRIVVLSPMGTTIFKMSEDRKTGKVSVENFVPQLKPYESKLTDYYASLRILLTTARHPVGKDFTLDAAGRPTAYATTIEGRPTLFTFAAYNEHSLPTELKIASDAFNVDVKVVGYAL